MPLFSFFRNRATEDRSGPAASSSPERLEEGDVSVHPIDQLLKKLGEYLPQHSPSLPEHGVSVVSIVERSAGLGSRLGIEKLCSFPLAEFKGARLDAVVRFELWAATTNDAEALLNRLNSRLMAERSSILWNSGLLKLSLESSPPMEFVSSLNAWRKIAEYRTLYEFRYLNNDDMFGLIARIPIASDLSFRNSQGHELTEASGGLVRWDQEAALPLVARGPLSIAGIAALSFVPSAVPSGAIVLTRTFDGASGPPAVCADWPSFLSAAAARHAQLVFFGLADFLEIFKKNDSSVWLNNASNGSSRYQPQQLAAEPKILLPSAEDRFEMAHQNAVFDQPAVMYLRIV